MYEPDEILQLAAAVLGHDEQLSWYFLMEHCGMPVALGETFGVCCIPLSVSVQRLPEKVKKAKKVSAS